MFRLYRVIVLPFLCNFAALCSWGCVPLKEITDAPCPCPVEDYMCCNDRCVKIGTCNDENVSDPGSTSPIDGAENETDPETGTESDSAVHPTHTDIQDGGCAQDTDCEDEEKVCISWQDETGVILGPRTCNRKCGGDLGCDGDDICELVLHDGRPYLHDKHATLACVDSTPAPGCGAVGCRECKDAPFGSTYCYNEKTVAACFTAFDENCGLYCENVVLEECIDTKCRKENAESHASCRDTFRGPPFDDEICTRFSCDDCQAPGTASPCERDLIEACVYFPIEDAVGAACDALCRPTVFENCE